MLTSTSSRMLSPSITCPKCTVNGLTSMSDLRPLNILSTICMAFVPDTLTIPIAPPLAVDIAHIVIAVGSLVNDGGKPRTACLKRERGSQRRLRWRGHAKEKRRHVRRDEGRLLVLSSSYLFLHLVASLGLLLYLCFKLEDCLLHTILAK